MFRTILKLLVALTVVSLVPAALAQQNPTAPQPAPVASQPAAQSLAPAPAAAPVTAAQVPAPALQAAPSPADAPADNASKSLKATAATLREFSPWSMFLSADIVVKSVMIGLAFASLMTWTI